MFTRNIWAKQEAKMRNEKMTKGKEKEEEKERQRMLDFENGR